MPERIQKTFRMPAHIVEWLDKKVEEYEEQVVDTISISFISRVSRSDIVRFVIQEAMKEEKQNAGLLS